MIFSLILAFPLATIAQDDGGAEKQKKERSTSFSPYWMIMAELGPSFSHTDLAKNQFAPDFNYVGYNGQIGLGRQLSSVFSLYLKGGYGSVSDGKEKVTMISFSLSLISPLSTSWSNPNRCSKP